MDEESLLKQQKKLIELSNETEGWEFLISDENTKIMKKRLDISKFDCLKATTTIPNENMKEIGEFVLNNGDKYCEEGTTCKYLKEINEKLKICYIYCKLPFLITDRLVFFFK
jgi:hypothetical protein